ncbi:hypothetical protein PXD56_13545 [Maribacter sp. SA7]|uniref:hypothetical protein n=1 Tax=Maribacter zhoushanensis TaxID=3030012 RepID=UPI0023EAABF1|nr:hypothetical protein [Maribacter zhoushanensis]MDF4203992.1 hypothetical protein [Maribacter zhoushanensis]
MKNSNLLQKIGIAIIILSWSVRFIGKFLEPKTAEMFSDLPLISILGIGIWTVGYFKKESEKKKITNPENSIPDSE